MSAHPDLLDASPIPAMLLRDGEVVWVNAAALRVLGRTREEVLGRPASDFLAADAPLPSLPPRGGGPGRGEGCPAVYPATLLPGGRRRAVKVYAAARGGEELLQILEEDTDPWCTVASDGPRTPGEARRRVEELDLVLEVGRSLVGSLELDQVLDAGVRNLARIVDAPDAYLLLADASATHPSPLPSLPPQGGGLGRGVLRLRAAAGSHPELVGRVQSLEEHGVASWVFRHRAPLVVEDAANDARSNRRLLASSGARAYLGVPLVVRDRAIGVALIVETRGPRRFTAPEVERAAAIANQLAVAVENARLYEDLRRSYADLAHAQDQLVRKERLAALGELAAVVAHEVRNPLGVIFNSLGSLRRLVWPKGDATMLLEMMGEEADRLNRIVGDLLDFARPRPATLLPEPLDRVLDEAVAAALGAAGHGTSAAGAAAVTWVREIAEGLPPVPMDARLIRQAVLNVVANAVQAMPEGGTLTVRARGEGGAAAIEIADTGPGIPEDVRGRIFEPFFTTKATGTGLGLAVVKRIVDDHRGSIEVRPDAAGGTVFTVRLPLVLGPGAGAGTA